MEAIRKIELNTETPAFEPHREAELIDYLLVLWRWRLWIILGTVAAAATAAVVSSIVPKTYQATTTLMVTRSKFGLDSQLAPQQLALTAKTFEGIIRNRGAVDEAIAKFDLAAPPYSVKPRDLMDHVESNVVKDTSLLTLSVEFRDPQRAADIANFLATRAIELNNTLNEGEIGESRTFLETQVQESAATLKEEEATLENYQKKADIEIVRKTLEIRLARYGELEAQRTKVQADLAAASGSLTSLEKTLAEQPATLTISRNLVADSAYQQALAKLAHSDLNALLGMNMQSQEVNPVHTFVEQQLAEVQRNVSSLGARKAQIEQSLAENNGMLDSVQTDLVEKTTQMQRLIRAFDLQRDSYKLLRARLDAANVEVASKTNLLKVVDQAVTPQRALRPRKTLNTAIGALAGLICMVTIAFVGDYVQRAQSELPGAAS